MKASFDKWFAMDTQKHVETKMEKNIILCSDGTGNQDIKNRGTNVFKLYEAIDIHGHKTDFLKRPQIAIYDDGLGTKPGFYLLGQAFGFGFARNVKRLYMMLSHVYSPGDRIYLFGFSRGAYTVRTLSGMIQHCGVIDSRRFKNKEELDRSVSFLWEEYRAQARQEENKRTEREFGRIRLVSLEEAQKDYSRILLFKNVSIQFIGVWDTVGAIGMPFKEITKYPYLKNLFYWFNSQKPGPYVENARQALAIDDERKSFHPELWDEEGDEKNKKIKQVWFAGSHSNAGGGYPKQGMSLVALDWMMAEAESCGLRFIKEDREFVSSHQDVHDKLYDSREGMGLLYRWEPRDLSGLCKTSHCFPPKIHISVLERMDYGTEGYAPGNIPDEIEVVATRTDLFGLERVEALNSLFRQNKGICFSEKYRCLLFQGKFTYLLFVFSPVLLWIILQSGEVCVERMIHFCFLKLHMSCTILFSEVFLRGCEIVFCLSFLWGVKIWGNRIDKRFSVIANKRWQPLRQSLFKAFLKPQDDPDKEIQSEKNKEQGDL